MSSDPGARSSTTLQSPQRHHRSNAGNAVALGADNCRALAQLAALACTILQRSRTWMRTPQVIYIIALVVMMLWGKACSSEHALACFGHVGREFGSIRLDKQDM